MQTQLSVLQALKPDLWLQVAAAAHLRQHTVKEAKGRSKLGVEAFAEALLGIPKTLAENSGLDAHVRPCTPCTRTCHLSAHSPGGQAQASSCCVQQALQLAVRFCMLETQALAVAAQSAVEGAGATAFTSSGSMSAPAPRQPQLRQTAGDHHRAPSSPAAAWQGWTSSLATPWTPRWQGCTTTTSSSATAYSHRMHMQETIISLQEEQASGSLAGLDIESGDPLDPALAGLYDNYIVKRQILQSAPIIATQLLLVDEVLRAGANMRRGGPGG